MSIKTFSMLSILVVSVAMGFLIFSPPTVFPALPMYLAGAFVLFLLVRLYLFSCADFEYVKKKNKGWVAAGPTELSMDDKEHLVFTIGTKQVRLQTKLDQYPETVWYFGRWTVYFDPINQIAFWHDHGTFGAKWYYLANK